MGSGYSSANVGPGKIRTGCGDIGGQHQRGSMLVLGISTLVICLLLLGLGVNLGYWNYKKTMVADAAELIARAAIKNQVIYREARETEPDYPDTSEMMGDIIVELGLPERLHGVDLGWEFGNASYPNGTGFQPASDPQDPNPGDFNSVRIQLCSPLDDLTGLFALPGRDICAQAQVTFDTNTAKGCYCSEVQCPASDYEGGSGGFLSKLLGGLDRPACLLGCTVGSALRAVLNLLFTLDLKDLIIALDCILDTAVVTVNTTLDWLLGPGAGQLHWPRYT